MLDVNPLPEKSISGTNSIFTTQGAVISHFLRIKENFTKVLIVQSFWADMGEAGRSPSQWEASIQITWSLWANERTPEIFPTNKRGEHLPGRLRLDWWEMQKQKYFLKALNSNTCYCKSWECNCARDRCLHLKCFKILLLISLLWLNQRRV